ncbi:MAG: helix-turn-helix transcriptional regulator [Planctomycetes bacterium]|nr:helix-turn-helix transcriptional regulator [Planctomycetota bacterium]
MKEFFPEIGVKVLLCRFHKLGAWTIRNLSAPYWRLYWNDAPGAWVTLDGRRHELVPGRFMVIPPETAYSSDLSRPVRHFYLHFVIIPEYRPAGDPIYTFAASRHLLAAVNRIIAMLDSPQPPLELAVLTTLLACQALARAPAENFQSRYPDERVNQAVAHMDDCLSEPLSNSDLAGIAHMNTNAFIRLFRRTTGSTPRAYLARKRIDRACMMLHHTDYTIEQIAEQAGFCDRYHFSRTFKRIRGMGPGTFRKTSDPGIWPK